MKRIRLIALTGLLTALLLLCACGETVAEGYVGIQELTTESSALLTYDRFDSAREYELICSAGTGIGIRVCTEAGELYLVIRSADGACVFEEYFTENAELSVPISADGVYRVTASGQGHQGELLLKWTTPEQVQGDFEAG